MRDPKLASTRFLVCAIDGTGSATWRPAPNGYSHTHKLYQNFGAPAKKAFWDGPNGPGTNVGEIISGVLSWLAKELKESKGSKRPPVHTCPAVLKPEYETEIVLIGHSRGATIAGDVARKLEKDHKIGVYFLALLDAVDRSYESEGGTVDNVNITVHAVRGLIDSRPSFGNTYRSSSGMYRERIFQTSHGGIGGSMVSDPTKVGIIGDASCALASDVVDAQIQISKWAAQDPAFANALVISDPMLTGSTAAFYKSARDYEAEARRLQEEKDAKAKKNARCDAESKMVYQWLLTEAVAAGLPLS